MSDIDVIIEPPNTSIIIEPINYKVQISSFPSSNSNNTNTGQLTGIFYPLNSNPAGYVTSSAGGTALSITGSQFLTGAFISGNSGVGVSLIGNNILIYGNNYSFNTVLSSGIDSQFILYPQILSFVPIVSCILNNNLDNLIYSLAVNGVTNSGFNVGFSDTLVLSGYILSVTLTI